MVGEPNVESHLDSAARWCGWLLLVRRLSVLAMISLLLIVAVGCSMYWGWFASALGPTVLLVLIGVGATLAAILVMMLTIERRTDDRLLASALERFHPSLLDRLNTLVYLRQTSKPPIESVRMAIEQQTQDILGKSVSSCPFPQRGTWLHVAASGLMLFLTLAFFSALRPWRFVSAMEPDRPSALVNQDLELPAAAEAAADNTPNPLNDEPWVDVRISEPGKDLRVTPHEVIPLRIEAASNRRLTKVAWYSAKNGGRWTSHQLPRPIEPRYAAYDVRILLEEYDLRLWDVISYHAKATTGDSHEYDSQTYYIEIIPYRDQMKELPEGEDGEIARWLEELTSMIEQQHNVVRQTQYADAADDARRQSKSHIRLLDSLARAEAQLQQDVRVFEATLSRRMKHERAEEFAQPIKHTRAAFQDAEQNLRQRATGKALPPERTALKGLIDLRKQFYRQVSEDGDAFQPDARQQLVNREADTESPADARPPRSSSARAENDRPRAESDRLEERIRENAQQYEAVAEHPASFSPAQIEKTTTQTQKLARELQELAEQRESAHNDPAKPTDQPNQSPDAPLAELLGRDQLQRLSSRSDQLQKSRGRGDRQKLASEIGQQLQSIAEALADDRARQSGAGQRRSEDRAEQIQQMQQERTQLGEARDFLQESIEKQRNLQRAVRRQQNSVPARARQQLDQQQALEDYAAANPAPFENTDLQQRAARSAMRQAADAMQQGAKDMSKRASQAAEALRKLDDELAERQEQNQLVDAMQLNEMLQEQIEQLEQLERNASSASSAQSRKAGSQCKSLTSQLGQIGQNAPPGSVGSAVGEALGDGERERIDAASDQLTRSQSPSDRTQAASQLRERLEPLAALLGEYVGAGMKRTAGQSAQEGALQPGGRQAMERGLRQLDSLAIRQQLPGTSPSEQTRLSQEAQQNLSEGISGVYGHNETAQSVLQGVRDKLEEKVTPTNLQTVRELLQQIQSLRRESGVEQPELQRWEELSGRDRPVISPHYREWARKYFEHLSRQPEGNDESPRF